MSFEQKKSFEDMQWDDFESDMMQGEYGTVFQDVALAYMKEKDGDFFSKNFTGERDEAGYLINKDGTKPPVLLPSQNFSNAAHMKEVVERTKEELRRRQAA